MRLHILLPLITSMIAASFFGCGSEGKVSHDGGADADTDSDTNTDSETGMDLNDIDLPGWGDCTINNWDYDPPVTHAFSFIDNNWQAVELHGYLRKVDPYVYLDVQSWSNSANEFPLNTDIDLSAEDQNIFTCSSCLLYFEECTNPDIDTQSCVHIYWAISGTLRVEERGTAVGEGFKGVLTDVKFQEATIDVAETGDVTLVDQGLELCIHNYDFDETLVEY